MITSGDGSRDVRTSLCENEQMDQAGSVLAGPPWKIHFSCSTTFLLAQFLEHKGSVVSESRVLNCRIQFNNSFLSTYKRNRYRTSIFSTSRRGSRPDIVKYRRSVFRLALSLLLEPPFFDHPRSIVNYVDSLLWQSDSNDDTSYFVSLLYHVDDNILGNWILQ